MPQSHTYSECWVREALDQNAHAGFEARCLFFVLGIFKIGATTASPVRYPCEQGPITEPGDFRDMELPAERSPSPFQARASPCTVRTNYYISKLVFC